MASTDGGIFQRGLGRADANFAPLTPLGFLPRSASIYPDRIAVIHGERRIAYRDFDLRARRLASALARRGIGPGDTVSAVLPNVPAMLEAHFGVPMIGAVLNTINTRLDARTIGYILEHGEAKVLLTDREYASTVGPALEKLHRKPLVVEVDDVLYQGPGDRLGEIEYEALLATGSDDFVWTPPADESAPIALNYTSGTTGNPKGVVYHHRGAFLESVGNIMMWPLPPRAVYLWTLPMFHCNGWCYTWAVTAMGGTHVCLRRVDPPLVFQLIARERVTHMCGAPTVLTMLIQTPPAQRTAFEQVVELETGGSSPPAKVIRAMSEMGFNVTHLYGLTEVHGPSTLCAPQEAWERLELGERAEKLARQGVRYPTLDGQMVAESKTLRPVPADGRTVGEVVLRGNTVMLGYLKDQGGHRRGVRGRLVPHRRPRRPAPRRLHRDQGPREGHHHLGRREHLLDRGRDRAQSAPGRADVGGGGAPGREVGRDALRVRPAPTGRSGYRRGVDRLLPRQPAALRDPPDRRVRRAADHLDG